MSDYVGREILMPAGLYALTAILEIPVVVLRLFVALIASWLAGLILSLTIGLGLKANAWMLLGLLPTVWSMLALIVPTGAGWFWQQQAGGRMPSQRERLAFRDAVELLQSGSKAPLAPPERWFVLDSSEPDAAVFGTSLMLSRGLLASPFLPAVLAHELGHLHSSDGRVSVALARLVVSPRRARAAVSVPEVSAARGVQQPFVAVGLLTYGVLFIVRGMLAAVRGGLALRLLGPVWAGYWREREYAADAYAADIGMAEELADFLEVHALMYDLPVPFVWLSEHSHPATELRIDRLRGRADAEAEAVPEVLASTEDGR